MNLMLLWFHPPLQGQTHLYPIECTQVWAGVSSCTSLSAFQVEKHNKNWKIAMKHKRKVRNIARHVEQSSYSNSKYNYCFTIKLKLNSFFLLLFRWFSRYSNWWIISTGRLWPLSSDCCCFCCCCWSRCFFLAGLLYVVRSSKFNWLQPTW